MANNEGLAGGSLPQPSLNQPPSDAWWKSRAVQYTAVVLVTKLLGLGYKSWTAFQKRKTRKNLRAKLKSDGYDHDKIDAMIGKLDKPDSKVVSRASSAVS